MGVTDQNPSAMLSPSSQVIRDEPSAHSGMDVEVYERQQVEVAHSNNSLDRTSNEE